MIQHLAGSGIAWLIIDLMSFYILLLIIRGDGHVRDRGDGHVRDRGHDVLLPT